MSTGSQTSPPTFAICMPVHNEAEVLDYAVDAVKTILNSFIDRKLVSQNSYCCLIDDGSSDQSWRIIETLHELDPQKVHALKFSRNFGHQSALFAAYRELDVDALVTLDADLQDDPSVIEAMVTCYVDKGFDVVYGIRNLRKSDGIFKRASAEAYYKIVRLFDPDIRFNHADYRLLSRRAYKALAEMNERDLFLRGMVPKIGFPSTEVFYARNERKAGETKYPLRKMLSFAWSGITASSVKPLRAVALVGVSVFLFSLLLIGWVVYTKFFTRNVISGWASLTTVVAFFSGLNILCVAIVAEYLAKIFTEIKARPRYILESRLGPGTNRDKRRS